MREIGGDFDIEPGECESRVSSPLSEAKDVIWYSSGRMALKAILRAMPRGVFLIPSYLCDAVLQPFRELGVPYRFYPIRADLRYDIGELRRMRSPDVVGVLHLDLFGVQPDAEQESFLAGLVEEGMCVITDITHSYPGLTDYRGRSGTHILCSVRKTLPIPDGAFVAFRDGRSPLRPTLPAGKYVADKLGAQIEKHRYLQGAAQRSFLPAVRRAEAGFEQDQEIRTMSAASLRLFRALDLSAAAMARRRNFAHLLSQTAMRRSVPVAPLLKTLCEAGSPLGFPIVSTKRDELRSYLITRGVFPPVHWPLPPEAEEWARRRNAFAVELSSRILTIPCDQRYGPDDMSYVGECLSAFEPGSVRE